jgi:hypothetical protein
MLYLAGEGTAPEEVAVSDFDEAQREAQQFATYWCGERATVTRMKQRDPIALTPLASSESLEATAGDAPAGDAPAGNETGGGCLCLDRDRPPAARLCRAHRRLADTLRLVCHPGRTGRSVVKRRQSTYRKARPHTVVPPAGLPL